MAQAGYDLSAPTHLRNYLFFPAGTPIQPLREDVYRLGFACSIEEHVEEADGVLVIAEGRLTPAKEAIDRMVRVLFDLATRHHGTYDGWEAAPS